MTTDAPPPPPTPELTPDVVAVQDGVWFLDKLHPDTHALTLHRSYWVDGDLDVDALRAAWHAVLDRHQALRVTLPTVDGLPARRIGPARADAFTMRDVRDAAALAPPGDLDAGPLARLAVLRVTPRHHRVVLTAHQAVADPASLSVVAAALSSAYAEAIGTAAAAAAPARRDPSSDPAPARVAPLPADGVRPADPPPVGTSTTADEVAFDWGPRTRAAVQALARAEGVAVPTVVLAAFQVVLGRHRGEDSVTVALPYDLRGPGREAAVGPFSTLLPVDCRLTGDVTFRTHLRRVARSRRDAERRRRPFPRLVRAVNPPRSPDGLPLCDAVLAADGQPAPLRLAGATVRELPSRAWALPVDLLLTLAPSTATLAGTLAFRADRMAPRSAEGFLAHLRTLLDAAARDPDLALADLPLEDPRHLATVVRAADATADAPPPGRPVTALIGDRAERFPEAIAVRGEDESLTYAELVTRASDLAGWLVARVPVAGRAVALRLPMGPALVIASLAVLRAGGHLTWLSPGDRGDRARTVLTELRPAALLVAGDPAEDPVAEWYRSDQAAPVLTVDPAPRPVESAPRPVDPVRFPAEPDVRAAAYVAFTSGSTGRPKGIVQTHAALAQFATWLARTGDLHPGARVAQWAAVEHDPALCEVFAALVSGATLVPVPDRVRVHPERFLRWLDRERVTMLQTVPSFARELATALEGDAAGPARLAHLFLMGESLTADLANRLRRTLTGTRLWNLYGPTETVAASVYEIVAPVPGERVPIGRSIPGRQVLVVDGRDRPCPAGVTGEIVVRSPYAVPGYLPDAAGRQPGDAPFRPLRGLPPAAVATAGCYRTGDLGRRRFDGELEHVGRRDQQVKLAGHRLELAAVEAAVAAHALVADCAVSPVTDPDGLVSRLAVFVASRDGADWRALVASLRAHLRRRYGPVGHRTAFAPIERIPRNVGGKVDRARLPDPRAVTEHGRGTGRGPIENAVGRIWAEVLPAAPGDGWGDFFAAGGHSLLLVRLAHRLAERFGVDVPLRDLMAAPTVAGMAAVVRAVTAGNGDPTAGGAPGAAGQPRRWEDEHG
ncbi:AMP-binding protein [Micromonospora eburnea]|uniref:Amino acid adenylation domain-containing protein n=1 Tax=Micromonospora eburnea TaxID=227316 RepID=A0A1C6UU46_9ACTN|nr:AMP-binding protein [Micromonospora eburnea]SCL57530.1 amino acid adenylation domain-containing protein [Micromonospora eburnea]